MNKLYCSKCGCAAGSLWWRLLIGRQLYVCPNCGIVCSFCVEQYARPVPTCKYCGSAVLIKNGVVCKN